MGLRVRAALAVARGWCDDTTRLVRMPSRLVGELGVFSTGRGDYWLRLTLNVEGVPVPDLVSDVPMLSVRCGAVSLYLYPSLNFV